MLLLASAGCITPPSRGYPLYQATGPLAVEHVSTLYGYIARVDGRDVTSLGTAYVLAQETTSTGEPVRRIGPAKTSAEVDACLHVSRT
jgi:hypothetical protein